ncbi:hypothetical protein C2G38_935672 [Gigaspora rosea]|uniref:Uncharacterized protein n=1 Tax=Gigaspora rosea TaxID=44941 RepID=A0A397U394_9GLOM|nr:hypothetical protein C2G38_935672 [Gigaspora rosea]
MMQKNQNSKTVIKLKDGESTGWIKVVKKPRLRWNNLVIESQSSNRVAQTNAANNFVAVNPQQKLAKQKSRVTLKQTSLSQFFQLENKLENRKRSTTKEVNTSHQNQTIKLPAEMKSSRKRKDAQEETVGRHIKQGQNRQITLAMCFENSMKFYAQLKATKEKNNASKNCKKEIVMSKKQCQLKKINEKIQRKLVDFFHLKNKHTELSQTTIVASKFQSLSCIIFIYLHFYL